MIGVVLDELEVNAAGAAFDFWIGHLEERLSETRTQPDTPAQREAKDSLETAIIHAISARLRIAKALEDDYPDDTTFQQLLRATYDPYTNWTETERRLGWGDR